MKVLLIQPIHPAGVALLEAAGHAVVPASAPDMGTVAGEIADADAAITRNAGLDRRAMQAAARLRVLGVHGIGVDPVDLACAAEIGLPVANTPHANVQSVAELAIAQMLAIAKRVREITDGRGVPVVYDSVGKDTLMASLDSLAPRGTLVSNGTSSGPVVIDTTLLAVKGSIWLTRPAMVHYATPRSHMLAMADELFGHVLAGRIRGEPNQIFPLAEAAEAHRALESRRTVGATVLVP